MLSHSHTLRGFSGEECGHNIKHGIWIKKSFGSNKIVYLKNKKIKVLHCWSPSLNKSWVNKNMSLSIDTTLVCNLLIAGITVSHKQW